MSDFVRRIQDDLQPHLHKSLAEVVLKYQTLNEDAQGPKDELSFFENNETILEEDYEGEDDSRMEFVRKSGDLFQPAKGETFGDYELLEVVGRGGMGVVFRAHQISLDRIVAIKILPGGRFASSAAVERFQREANAVAALDHNNIVPIYKVGEHNGSHFIEMKLIEGESLAKWIQDNGPYNPKKAGLLLKEVAQAIAFAHQASIIHRDLKPGNILIDRTGKPWVVGFGLAKRLDDNKNVTRSGLLLGTPAYLAPEQADSDKPEATEAVDVYGLGAIFYTALTGHAPHAAHSFLEIIRQVVHVEPVKPRDVTPSVAVDLETICLKCLAKSPSDRYASAQDVVLDCDRFLNGRPIHAKRASFLKVIWKWARRNWVWILVFTALSSALVTAWIGRGQARTNLRSARISEAISIVSTDKVGRRFEALAAIKEAAEIERSLDLRDLGIAAMANVDLKIAKLLKADRDYSCAFDGTFERYATSDASGKIEIRTTANNTLVCTLPSQNRSLQRLEFNSDGKYLAAAYHKPTDNPKEEERFRIWNVETQTELKSIPEQIVGHAWEFDDQRGQVIVADRKGVINFFELSTDQKLRELPPGTWMRNIAISPDGKQIAISRDAPSRVEVVDSRTGEEKFVLPHDDIVRAVSWKPRSSNPNGDPQLATTSGRKVNLWRLTNNPKLWSSESHDVSAVRLAFSKNGEFIASADWEGKVCLWHSSDGSLILNTPGQLWVRFSDDGSKFAGAAVNDKIGYWDVAYAPEAKLLSGSEDNGPQNVDFSRCGRFFATSGFTGIKIWLTSNPIDHRR